MESENSHEGVRHRGRWPDRRGCLMQLRPDLATARRCRSPACSPLRSHPRLSRTRTSEASPCYAAACHRAGALLNRSHRSDEGVRRAGSDDVAADAGLDQVIAGSDLIGSDDRQAVREALVDDEAPRFEERRHHEYVRPGTGRGAWSRPRTRGSECGGLYSPLPPRSRGGAVARKPKLPRSSRRKAARRTSMPFAR